MNFHCIADEETVRGFGLAGVPGRAVHTPEEAREALDQAVNQADLGVLVLTDVVAAGIRERIDAIRIERDRPLIVEIPGPDGAMPGRKTLRQFVQEAVGVRVGSEEGG